MNKVEDYFINALLIAIAYISVWFLLAVYKKRFDLIDIAWGGGFIVIAVAMYLLNGTVGSFAQDLTLILVTVWGARLLVRIWRRNAGKPEDKRYTQMIKKYKNFKLFQVFTRIYLVQAVLMTLVALPLLAVLTTDKVIVDETLITVGFAVWAVGFIFEFVGDMQLDKFIAKKSGKEEVLDTGLWAYTRHPNYFGEITLWWGFWLISLSVNMVWWSVIGPLLITFLILFVSGVAPLEKEMKKRKAYREYAKRTSIFLPLPQKMTK